MTDEWLEKRCNDSFEVTYNEYDPDISPFGSHNNEYDPDMSPFGSQDKEYDPDISPFGSQNNENNPDFSPIDSQDKEYDPIGNHSQDHEYDPIGNHSQDKEYDPGVQPIDLDLLNELCDIVGVISDQREYTAFVCNLSFHVSENEIRRCFASRVNIKRFRVIDKRNKRFGFVTVVGQHEFQKLLDFNNTRLDSRRILVREADR